MRTKPIPAPCTVDNLRARRPGQSEVPVVGRRAPAHHQYSKALFCAAFLMLGLVSGLSQFVFTNTPVTTQENTPLTINISTLITCTNTPGPITITAGRETTTASRTPEDVVYDVALLLEKLSPRVGHLVNLLAIHVSRCDQALVLEPLQGGVDGPGRGAVTAVHPLLQLLHDLIAMSGLVLEQLEDHVLHIPGLKPLPAAPPPRPGPGSRAKPEAEGVPSESACHDCTCGKMLRQVTACRYIVSMGEGQPKLVQLEGFLGST